MPIERTAQTADTGSYPTQGKGLCLDCPQCTGTCWSLAELYRLPETILARHRTRSA